MHYNSSQFSWFYSAALRLALNSNKKAVIYYELRCVNLEKKSIYRIIPNDFICRHYFFPVFVCRHRWRCCSEPWSSSARAANAADLLLIRAYTRWQYDSCDSVLSVRGHCPHAGRTSALPAQVVLLSARRRSTLEATDGAICSAKGYWWHSIANSCSSL